MTAEGGPASTLSRSRWWGLTGLLLMAMGIATFSVPVMGILASFLRDEFDLTRGDIGTIVAVNTLLGAVLSPAAGQYADRLGGTRALVALFALGAASFLVAGLATGFAVLVVAGLVGGVSQALGNPATNKAIAMHVAPGRRGVIIGLKQSGVQAGIFLGGVSVPWLADTFGWRSTLIGIAVLAVAAVPLTVAVVPQEYADSETRRGTPTGPIPVAMWWLTAYGFLLGASGSAAVFIPLFAEESLGLSVRVGGAALGVVGLSAVAGRIVWARYAERTGKHRTALTVIAAGSVVGSVVMLLATSSTPGWLWLGVTIMGLSSSSWNSVGMLAVIDLSPRTLAGRASGRVLFGFLLGLGIAPPVYGEIVDRMGSYDPMWWISAALAALTVVITLMWRRARDEDPGG